MGDESQTLTKSQEPEGPHPPHKGRTENSLPLTKAKHEERQLVSQSWHWERKKEGKDMSSERISSQNQAPESDWGFACTANSTHTPEPPRLKNGQYHILKDGVKDGPSQTSALVWEAVRQVHSENQCISLDAHYISVKFFFFFSQRRKGARVRMRRNWRKTRRS